MIKLCNSGPLKSLFSGVQELLPHHFILLGRSLWSEYLLITEDAVISTHELKSYSVLVILSESKFYRVPEILSYEFKSYSVPVILWRVHDSENKSHY